MSSSQAWRGEIAIAAADATESDRKAADNRRIDEASSCFAILPGNLRRRTRFAPQQKLCSLFSMRRDKPWIFRTYAGHSSAAASNALYRTNLAKGQTGLSVAFDLPTQTGYDSDHALARGEVGKVGVPISHLGDMRTLFDGLPLERMNTS